MNLRNISLAAITASVVVLGLVPVAQAQVRVSPNYRLNSDSSPFRGQDQTALAVNRGNPQHVVQVNANYLDLICEASVSRDGGNTWSAATPLPFPAPGAGQSPFIPSCQGFQSVEFGSGQNVYFTAAAARTSPDFPDSSTLVWKSTDGGASWGPGVVAMPSGGGRTSVDPAPAPQQPFGPSDSRPSLSVVPDGGTGSADRIYVTALTSERLVTNGPTTSVARVAVSNDDGQTFAAPVNASPPGTSVTDSPSKPVINSDGSVTLLWRTTGASALLQASRSTNGGQTWGAPANVAGVVNTGTSTATHIPPVPLTGQSTSASYPRAVSGPNGDIYLTYSQGSTGPTPCAGCYTGADHFISPDSQVWFQRSRDNGATWSQPKKISEQTSFPGARTHQTRHPSVSFANNRINIVWHDRRHWYGGPGERNCSHSHIFCQDIRLGDTYLSYSTDSGSNFSAPKRVTDRSINDDVGYDTRPSAYWNFAPQSVTVGGGQLLVGWMDSREGNWDTDNEDTYLAKVNFSASGAPPSTSIAQSDPIARSVALSKHGYQGGNEGGLVGGIIDPERPPGCTLTNPPAPAPPTACPGGPASRNASAVVIVNQGDVAGALAGSVLARANPAPVLLAPALGLPASVKAEVTRMRPAGAFVIGDSSKLSSQVVTDLVAAGVPAGKVKRLGAGSDAATAALVAAEMDKRSADNKDLASPAFDAAVIANPTSPDAAAAAGLAAARRLPFLFVGADAIPAETQSALNSLDIDKALIIGGPEDVSENVRTQIGTLIGGAANATRLGGADQYATSKAVVTESKARGLPDNVVYFADGAKPMDAALLGNVAGRVTALLALAPAPVASTAGAQAADFGLTALDRSFLAVPAPPAAKAPAPKPSPAKPGGGGAVAAFRGCPSLTANVVRGSAATNTIRGTARGDRIFALGGNDIVNALGGSDCVDLGAGADRGQGGAGDDLILGGRGKDRAAGGSGKDKINGGADADSLEGGSGNDSLTGGSGKDKISGGGGNDRISARDRKRDRVSCGGGRRDTAVVDRIDRVSRNCERIRRRG